MRPVYKVDTLRKKSKMSLAKEVQKLSICFNFHEGHIIRKNRTLRILTLACIGEAIAIIILSI